MIRQRGQLTIPDQARKVLSWLQIGEMVGIEIDNDDELRIKPHTKVNKKVDWDSFWKRMELSRSFRGTRNDKPLSQMVVEDRKSH